jgi:hypothetical protein
MPDEANDIQQKIEARMAELPEDVRNAINDDGLDEKIRVIGQKFNLHIDQIGALGDEVMLALLGFTPLAGFAGELAAQLSLDSVLAQTIVAEINNSIFLSIRESMQKFAEGRSIPPPVPDTKPAATMMPSAPAPSVAPAAPTPVAALPAVIGPTTQVIAKPATPPPLSPDMHAAETIMSKTVVQIQPTTDPKQPTTDPKQPTTPPIYKADPYREPVE